MARRCSNGGIHMVKSLGAAGSASGMTLVIEGRCAVGATLTPRFGGVGIGLEWRTPLVDVAIISGFRCFVHG